VKRHSITYGACLLWISCAHQQAPTPTPLLPTSTSTTSSSTSASSTSSTSAPASPAATATPSRPSNVPVSLRTDPALGVISVEVLPGANVDPAQPIHLVVHSRKAQALFESMRAMHADATLDADGHVHVMVGRAVSSNEPPLPQHRKPTFVVDYDEPSVQQLAAKIGQHYGRTPTLSELQRDVAAHFTEPQHGGFDIASRAATLGRGDCSEHAVLLAAVARHFGYTVRVVLGFVAPVAHGQSAFGHAWTQAHDGSAWQTYDAALLGLEGLVYLPLHSMLDEGPGYVFSSVEKAMLMMSIERLLLAPLP
jgi:transglutaminase-like putative cysteine protease